MTTERTGHSATVLQNGQLLIAGGKLTAVAPADGAALNTAETYNATTGAWSATGSMVTGRGFHTATLLPNGKVLVAGGTVISGLPAKPTATTAVEIYDPVAGTWSTTGSMAAPRIGHLAFLLSNGKVLVVGGYNGQLQAAVGLQEVYDPSQGTWSAAGAVSFARRSHAGVLLLDGRVLVAGGATGVNSPTTSAELYNPSTDTWATTGPMLVPRKDHTLTRLLDGRVLATGGTVSGDAEIFDPLTETWSATSSSSVRQFESTVLLPNGFVLRVGGFSAGTTAISSAEVFRPGTSDFASTRPLIDARGISRIVVLPGGSVLIAGGRQGATDLRSAELY